jgi:hypothetical protein
LLGGDIRPTIVHNSPFTIYDLRFTIVTSGNMPPSTDNDENSGKVAKLHVVNLATLQPCNPVIFTSGNMPPSTDNDENRTLIPQMHADQH